MRAEGTRAPIAGAVVRIAELGRSARTDARGDFVLFNVPAGAWAFRVEALGYRPHEATVGVSRQGTVRLEFELVPQPIRIEGVEVEGRSASRAGSSLESGAASGPPPIRLDAAVVGRSPTLAEPDLFRALQMLPSVQAASDFSSALYVRGGLPDQNLLLLDGAPIFNPYHMGGLFSAFDPEATRWVTMLPGGFPAGVGDRLSSAIDVQTRDGDRERVGGGGGIGLISSRASVNGPLSGGDGSYLFSIRRTYLDLVADAAAAVGLIPGSLPYGFTDGHVKLTHDLGDAEVSASLYLNAEDLAFRASDWDDPETTRLFDEVVDFDWGSRVLSLGYDRPIGTALDLAVRAGLSDFHGTFGYRTIPLPEGDVPDLDARTLQRDLFGAADLTWHGREHVVRMGLQIDDYLLDHDVHASTGELSVVVPEFRRSDSPTTVAVYAEDEWSATSALSLRAGLRVLSAGPRGTEWLPRAGVRYTVSPSLTLSVGASRSAQVLRSLRNTESIWSSVMAYDFLAAVPEDGRLSTAEDVTLTAQWSRGSTLVRLDGYAKRMHGLLLAPASEDLVWDPLFITDSVRAGRAEARGLEVLARHSRGRATYSVSYALTDATMITGGERFTPRFERRHVLDASASIPLGESGLFTSRLALASGQPYTRILGTTRAYSYDPVTGTFRGGSGGYLRTILLGEHNSGRLPGYFRLDVGARRSFTRKWWGREVTFTPYLSVLNVLNTPNVLFSIPESYGTLRLENTPQIPIFPTFGIEWSF